MPEARSFIKSLKNIKLKAKTYKELELLSEFGPMLSMPFCKKITSSLYELRVKQSTNILRMFYFYHKDNIYIVTSGYIKKTQKLSLVEVKRAERLMTIFLEEKNG